MKFNTWVTRFSPPPTSRLAEVGPPPVGSLGTARRCCRCHPARRPVSRIVKHLVQNQIPLFGGPAWSPHLKALRVGPAELLDAARAILVAAAGRCRGACEAVATGRRPYGYRQRYAGGGVPIAALLGRDVLSRRNLADISCGPRFREGLSGHCHRG
jgi:hypothetical protein